MSHYELGYRHTLVKLGVSPELARAAVNKHLLRALWESIKRNPLRPTRHLGSSLDALIKRYPRTLAKGVK